MSEPDRLSTIVDALQLLAADAELQARAAASFREIAEELRRGDDVDRIDQQLRAENKITNTVAVLLDEIDTALGELVELEVPDPWTSASITGLPEWAQIRALARRTLMALDVPRQAPDWFPRA